MTRAGALALALSACTPSARDIVPEAPGAPPVRTRGPREDAYVHVARRPHGVVALAEARHLPEASARAIVERLADRLEQCAATLESERSLVEGAARVVAIAGPGGTPALRVTLAPGDAVARNALLCVLAPMRATGLPPPTSAGAPALALEATWGPLGAAR